MFLLSSAFLRLLIHHLYRGMNKQKISMVTINSHNSEVTLIHFLLKALMPITFSSPRAQPEVVYFLISNESLHFSDCKLSKISASNFSSLGDITKSVKLIGIPLPENNFLCIFIIASSPGVYTFFCLWRVNKKLPQGETSQNAFQRSSSINY